MASTSLVRYPESDPESDAESRNSAIGNKATSKSTIGELPPLPAAFHDLYTANARASTSDDPALHGGRKRAVPHVEGNWPTHVYLEWIPSPTESSHLDSLIQAIQHAIETANKERTKRLPIPDITPSLRSPLGAPLPLHISLSRTLQIRTDNRDAFREKLTSCLRRASVPPFKVHFDKLKWVPNFDQTRWFLVLGIERSLNDELNRLLTACNNAAEECGHPGLYVGGAGDGPMELDDTESESDAVRPLKRMRRSSLPSGEPNSEPSSSLPRTLQTTPTPPPKLSSPSSPDRSEKFHISIAWNLIPPSPAWLALVQDMDISALIKPPELPFDAVKLRIGRDVHTIRLGGKMATGRKGSGILGL